MLYISLKVRDKSKDKFNGDVLTKSDLYDLDRLQPRDNALYNAANSALDRRIELYGGKKFARITSVFKSCISQLKAKCEKFKFPYTSEAVFTVLSRFTLPHHFRPQTVTYANNTIKWSIFTPYLHLYYDTFTKAGG